MYTIKQASIRTGVTIPLLRAWERRYGIPTPGRTHSGYRLYDDEAIDRIRRMRSLVDTGWAPSQAARAILDGAEPDPVRAGVATDVPVAGVPAGLAMPEIDELSSMSRAFLTAAGALDDAAMEATLSDALALLGVDEALQRFVMPALVAVGAAWARGELDVAAEHAASSTVMRRLGALYGAAATPSSHVDCLIGLPPGSRHEVGALAFAVACRRAGLRVLYLGADVPVASWVAAAGEHPEAMVALGAVTPSEADAAVEVASALTSDRPDRVVAVGGARRDRVAAEVNGVVVLPESLHGGAAVLAARLPLNRAGPG
jgi:MerR family transcriptional regulator, light-induced transcriptional regulator